MHVIAKGIHPGLQLLNGNLWKTDMGPDLAELANLDWQRITGQPYSGYVTDSVVTSSCETRSIQNKTWKKSAQLNGHTSRWTSRLVPIEVFVSHYTVQLKWNSRCPQRTWMCLFSTKKTKAHNRLDLWHGRNLLLAWPWWVILHSERPCHMTEQDVQLKFFVGWSITKPSSTSQERYKWGWECHGGEGGGGHMLKN